MTSKPKQVAVIGAGISGVVAAAHLKKQGVSVTVFERSSAAGGVWFYDERVPLEPTYPSIVPLIAENRQIDKDADQYISETEVHKLRHAPPGPCYGGLKNNVATRMLETTLNPFPPGTQDFVSHSVLRDYIQDTALKSGVHEITRYDTEVKKLSKSGDEWVLEATTLNFQTPKSISQENFTLKYDSVVIASGHYHAPRIPDIPGLAAWKQRWPSRISHSKSYRKPDKFANQNVLLIGASVSSTDIASELGPFANFIYQSHRNGAFDLSASLLPENAVRVEEIVSFDSPPEKDEAAQLSPDDVLPLSITLKDGQTLCSIHHIMFCTGYHMTLPFLPSHHAPTIAAQPSATTLITDGNQLHNLHKDIFYIPDPTLLFIGVPYFTATFTLFEFQAMVAAQVVSGAVKLPAENVMRAEYEGRVREKGAGKFFHSLRDREEEYVNELIGWVNGELGERVRLEGHTAIWKEGKREQDERIKAMFASGAVAERRVEVKC